MTNDRDFVSLEDHEIVRQERDSALAELAEIKESFRETVTGRCGAGDEVHCSCVQPLRAEIEKLRAVVDATRSLMKTLDGLCGHKVDAVREALAALDPGPTVRICRCGHGEWCHAMQKVHDGCWWHKDGVACDCAGFVESEP